MAFQKGHKINVGRKMSDKHKELLKELLIKKPIRNTGRTRFKPGHGMNKEKENPMWKGGKYKTSNGYIKILSKNHPFRDSGNYVFEHRLIIEKKIGRFLKKGEVVHHINGNHSDNRIENLKLMKANNHSSLHANKRKPRNCLICDKEFLVSPKQPKKYCSRSCYYKARGFKNYI